MAGTQATNIPGWFRWRDRVLFGALLDAQADQDGVVVEIGSHLGRSAVEIGAHLGKADRFVVIDLFGADLLTDSRADRANERERNENFTTPTREQFERNYLAIHPTLPEIIQRPSREITQYVEPGTARFVHIDASHLFQQVEEDTASARTMLRADGIVVFDDYRAPQAAGVAAAVWGAVAKDGLVPFATTDKKLYATWGDATPHLETVRQIAKQTKDMPFNRLEISGHTVIRIKGTRAIKAGQSRGRLSDADLDAIAERTAKRLRPALDKIANRPRGGALSAMARRLRASRR